VAGPIAGRPRCSRLSAAVVVATAVLAGCGGSSHHSRPRPAHPKTGESRARTSPTLHPADPKRVAIVRAWADALRAGHVRKAATYFAIPAIAQNGGPELLLRDRAGVRAFNAGLPCGADVVRAVRVARYTIVTFVLTERRGRTPGCGDATGRLAATAFAFRRGKISEWRRVTIPPSEARKARAKAAPSA
jgi:hypothetical protein